MKYKNNPFNIRKGSNWLGLVGVRNGFCEFDTLEHGIRAFLVLMRTYAVKYNLYTVRDIITRFAPSSENDTEAYINYVCERLCLCSDDILTSADSYWRLAHLMAHYESSTFLFLSDIEYVWNFYHIANKHFPVFIL